MKQAQGNPATGPAASVRVVLLADEEALHCYGPVLRRFAVGLLDEVAELTLVCPEGSVHLEHLPSPPLRLVTESREPGPILSDVTGRQVRVGGPYVPTMDRLFPGRRVRRLTDAVRPFKPTLIHALSERLGRLARGLAASLEVPYVISLLALQDVPPGFEKPLCAAVLCANSSVARLIRQKHPSLAHRVHILPIGTHVSGKVSCLRETGRAPLLLCCSQYRRHLGLEELIRALALVHERGFPAQLLLAGSGPAEQRLRQYAHRCGVHEFIHLVPPIETVLPVIDAARSTFRDVDMYVQPSALDRWSPELLEAMSVGNAVLVIDTEANDLILPGQTAISLSRPDARTLADAIVGLLENPESARQLATNAQEHLRRHFLASRMVSRLARTYRLAVSSGSQAPGTDQTRP